MGFSDPITAGSTLIREAIKSPNYSPGQAGWTINQDGTAEFTGLTINQGSLYLYDTDQRLRLAIAAAPTPAARFFSTNPAETAPASLRAYDQGGYGRLELVGPELGGNAAGRVQIDSQDIHVSSAAHSGSAWLESPAGGIHITSAQNLRLETTGPGAEVRVNSVFVVEDPHAIHIGLSNFYADMGVHNGGKIILDPGSWVKRGALTGAGLQNGWYNFGGGYQSAGYMEYPDQTAGLVGVIGAGTTTFGTTLFTIPAAIRPAANHVFLAAGSTGTIAQVAVEAGGAVKLQSLTGGTPAWISLSMCRWPMNGF